MEACLVSWPAACARCCTPFDLQEELADVLEQVIAAYGGVWCAGDNQVLQTDFPKACLGTKECAMAARIDLDSILEDVGAPSLEDATLTYRCFPHCTFLFEPSR